MYMCVFVSYNSADLCKNVGKLYLQTVSFQFRIIFCKYNVQFRMRDLNSDATCNVLLLISSLLADTIKKVKLFRKGYIRFKT